MRMIRLGGLALAGFTIFFAACSDNGETTAPVTTPAPTAAATTAPEATATADPTATAAATTTPTREPEPAAEEVRGVIANFQLPDLTISAGTTIIWSNSDDFPHTATSDTDVFDSGTLTSGTYAFTFESAGTFPYHCAIHTDMKGTITVQ